MTPITAALVDRGIYIIPPSTVRARCPKCSHKRVKFNQPCLTVKPISDTAADVNCKHCNYRERIEA